MSPPTMRRLVALALLATAVAATPAQAVPAYRYEPYGPWLDLGASDSVPGPGPGTDANGIPVIDYGGTIGIQYNPFAIAANGLVYYSSYLFTENMPQIEQAVNDANWLVSNQQPDGRWLYRFPLVEYAIPPPWPSAVAQGAGLSLLVRVWRYTHNAVYLRAAKRALLPYSRPVASGGILSRWGDPGPIADIVRHLWFYQEAPSIVHPSFILNGFMYSLVGLYDLSVAAPRSTARGLYLRGWRSLVAMLPLYDYGPGQSLYNLDYLTIGAPKHPTSDWYNGRHVVLLRAIDSVTPSPILRHYMDVWG
jgi:heparosan-N-sulfate-glucuronate 5-epimerase